MKYPPKAEIAPKIGAFPESFQGRALYNGALQAGLTADLIMGLIVVGLNRDAEWLLEPLLKSAEAGDLQNGLCVKAGRGAEHHDWDGRPNGYEGYLPENWYFLAAALLRNPKLRRRLFIPAGGGPSPRARFRD